MPGSRYTVQPSAGGEGLGDDEAVAGDRIDHQRLGVARAVGSTARFSVVGVTVVAFPVTCGSPHSTTAGRIVEVVADVRHPQPSVGTDARCPRCRRRTPRRGFTSARTASCLVDEEDARRIATVVVGPPPSGRRPTTERAPTAPCSSDLTWHPTSRPWSRPRRDNAGCDCHRRPCVRGQPAPLDRRRSSAAATPASIETPCCRHRWRSAHRETDPQSPWHHAAMMAGRVASGPCNMCHSSSVTCGGPRDRGTAVRAFDPAPAPRCHRAARAASAVQHRRGRRHGSSAAPRPVGRWPRGSTSGSSRR